MTLKVVPTPEQAAKQTAVVEALSPFIYETSINALKALAAKVKEHRDIGAFADDKEASKFMEKVLAAHIGTMLGTFLDTFLKEGTPDEVRKLFAVDLCADAMSCALSNKSKKGN